jgi:hypothetical protein
MLILVAIFVGALLMVVASAAGVLGGAVLGIVAVLLTLWLFFWLVGKFAYVMQVLMVEGQGVFASVGRSVALAKGNWRRLAGLVLFSVFATGSALMIFYAPLIWYARANGIPIFETEGNSILPIWYSIAIQVIWQLSFVLLAPIWMLGLSLMYVDERVRHEAYDVELMAARDLGETPALVNPQHNPLRPALGVQPRLPAPTEFAPRSANITTLGLR